MKQVYRLKKLGCANCANKFERAVTGIDGVNGATLNFVMGKITLDIEPEKADGILKAAAKLLDKIEHGATITK